MTSAKELFNTKDAATGQSLAEWWIPIAHHANFEKVLMTARAHILQLHVNQAEAIGADKGFEELLHLGDNAALDGGFIPSPGLIHRIQTEQPSK